MRRVPLGTRHGTSLPALYISSRRYVADIYFIIKYIFPASHASNSINISDGTITLSRPLNPNGIC